MRRSYSIAWSAPLIALMFLSACAPDIVFVSDRYLAEVVVDDAFDSRLRDLSQQFDRRIRVSVVTQEGGLIPSESADCFLFAPLLRDVGLRYAETHPGRIFVFGYAPEEPRPNVGGIQFDRIAAFRAAGHEAARLADSEEGAGLVGLIFLADTEERRAERDAFLEGLGTGGAEAGVRSRVYPRQPRREDLRTDVRAMITRGVDILLIAVAGQNGFAMDLLAGQDVRVITEDAAATGGFDSQIVFSIERSMFAAIESVTRACVEGEGGNILVNADLRQLRKVDGME